MKKHIPNTITGLNLFSGCLAIYMATEGELVSAAFFILLAALFDFFDGMAARLLKVSSPIGKELDSLADVISFGAAPAFLALMLLKGDQAVKFWHFFPFIIAVFSALRLAKFNLDERQTDSFIGLPTPANALFWMSIPLINMQVAENPTEIGVFINQVIHNEYFILVSALLLSLLLVAELPLFSLKFKNLKWKENSFRFILLGISIMLIVAFYFIAIPFILILYLILSVIHNRTVSKNEIQS